MLTSRSDSNFERSDLDLKENKADSVNLNSNGLDNCVKKSFYDPAIAGINTKIFTLAVTRLSHHRTRLQEYVFISFSSKPQIELWFRLGVEPETIKLLSSYEMFCSCVPVSF